VASSKVVTSGAVRPNGEPSRNTRKPSSSVLWSVQETRTNEQKSSDARQSPGGVLDGTPPASRFERAPLPQSPFASTAYE
jgi:hypothetical protein